MSNEQRNDLTRFLLDNSDVRGELLFMNSEWQRMMSFTQYPPIIQQLLGEAVAATALLAATVKFDGAVTLQIQGEGAVNLLVVQVRSDGTLRGMAKYEQTVLDELPKDANFQSLIGHNGRIVITIEMGEHMQDYQGVVPAEGERLQTALEYYFEHSEQIPTRLWLAAGDNAIGGLLVQKLPDSASSSLAAQNARGSDDAEQVEDTWQRATVIADTIKPDELLSLPADDLLYRLFHEEDVRLFDANAIRFECSCSQQKTGQALKSLGQDDAMSLVKEQGAVQIDCQFCQQTYSFDAMAVAELFAPDSQTSAH